MASDAISLFHNHSYYRYGILIYFVINTTILYSFQLRGFVDLKIVMIIVIKVHLTSIEINGELIGHESLIQGVNNLIDFNEN